MESGDSQDFPAGTFEIIDAHQGIDAAVVVNMESVADGCGATVRFDLPLVFFRAVDARVDREGLSEALGEHGVEPANRGAPGILFEVHDSSLVNELCSMSFGMLAPSDLRHARLVASNCVMDVVFYADEGPAARPEFGPCLAWGSADLVSEGAPAGLPRADVCGGAAGACREGIPQGSGGLFSGGGRLEALELGDAPGVGEYAPLCSILNVSYGPDGSLWVYMDGGLADPSRESERCYLVVEGDVLLFRSAKGLFWLDGARALQEEYGGAFMGSHEAFRVCDSPLAGALAQDSGGLFSAKSLTHMLVPTSRSVMEVVFDGCARLVPA